MTSREFFPDSPETLWRQNRDWLSPDFWNPDTDTVVFLPLAQTLDHE